MINANDLKDIDGFLAYQEAIINQPELNKIIIRKLRIKIAKELKKFKIKVKK